MARSLLGRRRPHQPYRKDADPYRMALKKVFIGSIIVWATPGNSISLHCKWIASCNGPLIFIPFLCRHKINNKNVRSCNPFFLLLLSCVSSQDFGVREACKCALRWLLRFIVQSESRDVWRNFVYCLFNWIEDERQRMNSFHEFTSWRSAELGFSIRYGIQAFMIIISNLHAMERNGWEEFFLLKRNTM